MRRPRDFDAELKALTDRARQLKEQKLRQLGELVLRPGLMRSTPRYWLARCWLRHRTGTARQGRAGGKPGLHSFSASHANLLQDLSRTTKALCRSTQARNRRLATLARHDNRAWQVTRRQRTRQLIELGGLVAKAGLIELIYDDRTVLLGLLVEAAAKLSGDNVEQQLGLWRRRGKRAFEAHSAP